MLTKRIIPCLDIDDGRVVKGVNFVNLRDAGDPVVLCEHYSASGADELVLLDITATSDSRQHILETASAVAAACFIPFTVGGGVRTVDDISQLLATGADRVAINSAGLANPEFITTAASQFGCQCIVVAIDVRRSDDAWHVFSHGGRIDTGRDALSWAIEARDRGAGELLVTSMDADGTKAGCDNEITRLISESVDIPVIASGGIGTREHFRDAITEGQADAVLAASVFHYGELTIGEVKAFLDDIGVPVRPLSESYISGANQ